MHVICMYSYAQHDSGLSQPGAAEYAISQLHMVQPE